MIKVSVVIPVYNGSKHLREAINSVLAQTLQDWEILAINEMGSDDGSAEILEEFSRQDDRIQLIQNTERLGLAESINVGIRLAKGEFIARLDADDLAHPERFQKQVDFMYANPNVIVCGTYQHHFGRETDWVHKPAIEPKQCKANLLFFCDMCHSTVMLRKNQIIENNLWYDNSYLAEDFELWVRAADSGDIANIPEVLGEYRWGNNNITKEKMGKLHEESGIIVARSLKNNLNLDIKDSEIGYFSNWHNPYDDFENKDGFYYEIEMLLRKIYEKNKDVQYYDSQALLNVIGCKWRWIRYNEPFNHIVEIRNINDIFRKKIRIGFFYRIYYFWINNKGIITKLRKLHRKLQLRIGEKNNED